MTPLDVLTRIGQLIIGFIFIVACLSKARNVEIFIRRVRAYDLVNQRLERPLSFTIITLEFLVGIMLVLGWSVWLALCIAMMLIVAFAVGISVNLKRHRMIRCGCFSDDERISPFALVRLLLMFILVAICLSIVLSNPTIVQFEPSLWNLPSLFDYITMLLSAGGIIVLASLLFEFIKVLSTLIGKRSRNKRSPTFRFPTL